MPGSPKSLERLVLTWMTTAVTDLSMQKYVLVLRQQCESRVTRTGSDVTRQDADANVAACRAS